MLDQYGNLVSGDNTDVVTLALGTNPGAATLGGITQATVSGGVATFSNLTVSAAGNGYTLTAASGSLTGATSAAFNTSAASSSYLVEGFETTETWYVAGGSINAFRATYAAHDGTYGLDMRNGNGWIYRTDAAAQVKAGDTLSVWVQFAGSANGRAYFGFGASSAGTLSLVAAPNTGQLILQSNAGFGFTDLADVEPVVPAQPLVPTGGGLGHERHHRRQAVRQQRHDAPQPGDRGDHVRLVGWHRVSGDGQRQVF